MPRLGVNIDHIATLRQARRIDQPDPFASLPILVSAGVHQVTIHLREDRRHIQDHDLERVVAAKLLPVNLEMALTDEMLAIALKQKPYTVTFVPEKREEVTTEGGLDCVRFFETLQNKIPLLKKEGIRVSLFIDPEKNQIDAAVKLKADAVELHTGAYCEAFGKLNEQKEYQRLVDASRYGAEKKIAIFAGHGLNIHNLPSVIRIKEIQEYNIGHSIIGRSVFLGLEKAVKEIFSIING